MKGHLKFHVKSRVWSPTCRAADLAEVGIEELRHSCNCHPEQLGESWLLGWGQWEEEGGAPYILGRFQGKTQPMARVLGQCGVQGCCSKGKAVSCSSAHFSLWEAMGTQPSGLSHGGRGIE